jgi:hypothetical protein
MVLIVEVPFVIYYQMALFVLASHSNQLMIPSASMQAEKVISCP